MNSLQFNYFYFSLIFIFLSTPSVQGQSKKKVKRPNSRVGIATVDDFVSRSFDIYDKVYRYEGYKEAGKSLDDDDLDVLELAIEDVTFLSASAPDLISSLEGRSVLKQSKAMLQINRAKKALKYSLVTSKALLVGKKEEQGSDNKDEKDGEEKDVDPKNMI